jgi:MOSC domain-containing protein YiiM
MEPFVTAIPTSSATRPKIEVISVNVGIPRSIGMRRGHPVLSGIVKESIQEQTLRLDTLNLTGDRQADLRVHGGPDKAVYAYPSEHLPRWNEELGVTFAAGTFGENLSTLGATESDVSIGDIWAWGDALLQVTQPRSPCYKLAMITGRPDLLKRLIANGRTGWYLRVLQPGNVPILGPIRVVEQALDPISVLHAHQAIVPGALGRSELQHLASIETLASSWRDMINEQLDRVG